MRHMGGIAAFAALLLTVAPDPSRAQEEPAKRRRPDRSCSSATRARTV